MSVFTKASHVWLKNDPVEVRSFGIPLNLNSFFGLLGSFNPRETPVPLSQSSLFLLGHSSWNGSNKCCSEFGIFGQGSSHLFHQNLRDFWQIEFRLRVLDGCVNVVGAASLRFCQVKGKCLRWGRAQRCWWTWYWTYARKSARIRCCLHLRRLWMIVLPVISRNQNRLIFHTSLNLNSQTGEQLRNTNY